MLGARGRLEPSTFRLRGDRNRKASVGSVRQRRSDKLPGKLEQSWARQNIGHVIGHGSQPAVTIRAAYLWQGERERLDHPIAIGCS
jgi:hypothetical protein